MTVANRGKLATVIMAAGRGRRMKTDRPKVLHEVHGRPMIVWVVECAVAVGADPIVIITRSDKEEIVTTLADYPVTYAIQHEQLGTANAVEQARQLLADFSGQLIVLSGDVPGIEPETIDRLLARQRQTGAAATLLSAKLNDPSGYGRVLKNGRGQLQRIVEDKDASDEERRIHEINAGIYIFDPQPLFDALPKVQSVNIQREYYLPDVFPLLMEQNLTVAVELTENLREIRGVNTRKELQEVHAVLSR